MITAVMRPETNNFTQDIEALDRKTDQEARARYDRKDRAGIFVTVRAMLKDFTRVYFNEKSHDQGVPRLFRAVNAGMFHFLVYAKYWELEKNARNH